RAVGLEDALDALAVRHLAHREGAVQAAVALGDDHALEDLQALAITFDHLHLHHDGVTVAELGHLPVHLFGFVLLDNVVHRLSNVHFRVTPERSCNAQVPPLSRMYPSSKPVRSSSSSVVSSRSGLSSQVRPSDCFSCRPRISAWLPSSSTCGTRRPSI